MKRSMLSAELITFSDLFYAIYTSAKYFENVFGNAKVTVRLVRDRKFLFDIISERSHTSEKGVVLDIACARERYRELEIDGIGSVRSRYNFAGRVTKKMKNKLFIVSANHF